MNDMAGIYEKYEKTGYLQKHFRLFHIEDMERREFAYHYHDFDKIICFLGGRADYMIEGKKYSLEPYDFVLVNRNEIHRPEVDFSMPYERMILYIEHEFLKAYRGEDYDLTGCFGRAQEQKANVLHFPAGMTGRLCETLKRLEECTGEKRYAGELQGELLFLEFMIQLNEACLEYEHAYDHRAKYNKKIIDMMRFINENLGKDLSIDRLAERFYMSKYHMMRQFKEETGYSIHQYISEKRLLAAKGLIREGMSAGAAALECGFQDYSAFARAFKKKMGMAPSDAGNAEVFN
jgi:AraC-type DNA-binding domain-containing proteins